MSFLASFILVLGAFDNFEKVQSSPQHPRLLVVSNDGFRYDYLYRDVALYMQSLKTNGTYADYMVNVFPTSTFPNHHSIATGFYVESHGVLDTAAYVPNRIIKNSAELFQYNRSILPIWTINENAGAGRHSGVIMWPGAEHEYGGTLPKFVQLYNQSIPWDARIDTLISWFLHPTTPINFGMLYIEEPDFQEHGFGVRSSVINETLKKVDHYTKYLHERLEESNLIDINVIHLSDHGMMSVRMDRIINISDYLKDYRGRYKDITRSAIIMITPDPEYEDTIYNALKKYATTTGMFDVYKKAEFPDRFHFKNNPRVGPIIVCAKVGYAFEHINPGPDSLKKDYNITVTEKTELGLHGYDNLEMSMHPIFFANGPAFLDRCKLQPFNTVDLVPLFCKILKLDCPQVDGNAAPFDRCLACPINGEPPSSSTNRPPASSLSPSTSTQTLPPSTSTQAIPPSTSPQTIPPSTSPQTLPPQGGPAQLASVKSQIKSAFFKPFVDYINNYGEHYNAPHFVKFKKIWKIVIPP